MRRIRRFRNQQAIEQINLSPLIDMVFILLIFFIVTTVFVEETGVEVSKPKAVSAQQLIKKSIYFAISQSGNVVYGNREIGVMGVGPIVKRLSRGGELPVIIEADESVPTHLLVDVIDEAKLAGADSVSIATRR